MFPPPQNLEDVEVRLVTLSERITLCNRVLNDLKDLGDVLVVSSPFLCLEPCDLLHILKVNLGYVRRENLSRMCPYLSRSDQKWKKFLFFLKSFLFI